MLWWPLFYFIKIHSEKCCWIFINYWFQLNKVVSKYWWWTKCVSGEYLSTRLYGCLTNKPISSNPPIFIQYHGLSAHLFSSQLTAWNIFFHEMYNPYWRQPSLVGTLSILLPFVRCSRLKLLARMMNGIVWLVSPIGDMNELYDQTT